MNSIRALALAFLVALGLQSAYAEGVVLQIGSTAPVNSPWDLGLKKIASEWSRISGGQVRIVFPKSVSSASQQDLIQKMKFSLDGAVLDTTGLGFIDNDAYFLSMPSLIRDDAEYERAMAVAEPLIRERMSDRYELIATAKAGWIRFFSNQPVRTPDDLRRVRMGVNRNMEALSRLMQSIGVRTVKADSSSTLLQFSSGALDAMYSSPLYVAALWSQYRRAVTHMTAFKVAPFFGAIVINKDSWEKVPDSLKPALLESARRVARDIGAEAARLEEEGIAAMVKGGLVIPPYDASDAEAWNELFANSMKAEIAGWYSPGFTSAVYAALGR